MLRACGFVIFRRMRGEIEYLLMQTSYGTHHWTPPKAQSLVRLLACDALAAKVTKLTLLTLTAGHVDPGESDMQTALRETEEEAGLGSADLKVFEHVQQKLEYNVNGKSKTVIYWLAELINRNKSVRMSEEHQAFKWLPLDEACALVQYDEMQNALKEFNKYIVEKVI